LVNLPKIDGTSVAIDFPLLTQLIQQDWERVMGGEAAGGCRSSTDSATADRTRGIPDVAL
jgi:hypothetical protein